MELDEDNKGFFNVEMLPIAWDKDEMWFPDGIWTHDLPDGCSNYWATERLGGLGYFTRFTVLHILQLLGSVL